MSGKWHLVNGNVKDLLLNKKEAATVLNKQMAELRESYKEQYRVYPEDEGDTDGK